MKTLLAALAAAGALLSAGAAAAQSAPAGQSSLPFTLGPVWDFSYIEVKPGQFDNYMRYLSGNWRKIQEANKARGDVLDYKVLGVESPRKGEPDLILAVQFKNMAVFDRSPDEGQAVMSQVTGMTPQQASQGSIDREAMRTNIGSMTLRELRFR